MNSFLIYIPGKYKSSGEAFEAAGLKSIAGGESTFESPRTPEGEGRFYVWTDPRDPAKNVPLAYEPDAQVWTKSNTGKFWFGWWQDRVPNAGSLARSEQIPGFKIRLGDGAQWLLPSIHGLPVSFRLDADGKEGSHVKAAWKHIEERMMWAFGELSKNWREDVAFDDPECRKYVAEMLCVNYRMVPEMAYALDLIDSATWMDAFGATLDRGRLEKLKQEIDSRGESQTPEP